MSTRRKKKTAYGMQDTLPFGQYKDRSIASVVRENPGYLDWLWAVQEFEFTKEVWTAVKKAKAERDAK